MSKIKTIYRLTAMILSVIMTVSMMPVSAAAETSGISIGASGKITAFETLREEIASQSVSLGTSEIDLELPDVLTATIRLAALEEEPVLDSGEDDADLDSTDTVSGSAIGIDEMDDIETGGEVEITSLSDAEEAEDSFEAEPTEKTVNRTDEITVPLPVIWASSPEYDGEVAGTYVFTPQLPEGLTLVSGLEVPAIVVIVGVASLTGTVTAFDELPEDIRWQNTTTPKFPETVGGTVVEKAAQIPVTWEPDHDYDVDSPVRGLYVFTAILGEKYGIADGVELPRMTVFIPVSAGRMAARMVGGGTTDNPLEITTAAQLAEIATLVNARENGLELFLFNDAAAHITLEQQNDIDLSAYTKGEGWVPIGGGSNQFKGIFDGGGHKISNLTIDRSGMEYQGLFGYIGVGSLVKNLGVENTNILAKSYVGGVAGSVSGGTVQNCYTTGSVVGKSYVGGLVGCVSNDSTVQNCYATSSIVGLTLSLSIGSYMIGGLAGASYNSTVKACYVTGNVVGSEGSPSSLYAGGVVGYLAEESTMQNCAALNHTVVGSYDGVGRVTGSESSDFPVGNSWLSGNIAFGGMMVTQNDSAKIPVAGTDQVDGESKTADNIKVAGFFEALFGNDTAWTYAEGKLPTLTGLSDQSDALPAYITGLAGSGTSEEDPCRIYTAGDLKYMADMVNSGDVADRKFFRLENNIDLSAYGEDYDDGKGWLPIGHTREFYDAVFDGNGKTITGLYINRSDKANLGLFGRLIHGTIKNLSLEDFNIRSDTDILTADIGGLTGWASGSSSISDCAVTGSVSGTGVAIYNIGGMVGSLIDGSTVTNSAFYGTVSAVVEAHSELPGTTPSAYAGGIVGQTYNGAQVTNCVGVATVTATGTAAYAGGISGCGYSGAQVTNCASVATVTATGTTTTTYAGGISGYVYNGMTIKHCAALGALVSDTGSNASRIAVVGDGGTLGNNHAWSGMKVNGSTVFGIVNDLNGANTATDDIQTLWTTDSLNTWNPDVWTLVEGKLPVLTRLPGQNDALPAYLAGFSGAGTSAEDPYRIYTADDLKWLADQVNGGNGYSGKYFHLENDIDLSAYGKDYDSGKGWTPIGTDMINSFMGSFDGGGNKITNLTIHRPAVDKIGLFGYLYHGSKVQNIRIIGASVSGKNNVGGIAGYAWVATVENCAVTGSISGAECVGGVVGFASTGMVRNCYSTGNVTGTGDYVGGIVGYIEYDTTTVQCCYSSANVTGASSVGGVAGVVYGTVQNCYSTGNVTGTGNDIGGVAGEVLGTVKYCYSNGSVVGTGEYIGGVAGVLGNSGTVKNCVALNPSIKVGTYNFGRVVGSVSSGTLLNNYAFSRIPGTWANKGLDKKDGVDVTSQTLFISNFWTMSTYWDTAAWDGMVWRCETDKLPMLWGLEGQYGEGGLYLTVRDIQYATVGTIGSLTYNGSEQVPSLTITFDGETLTKDSDYTVSITSTDGSGTSTGTNAGTVTLTITGIGSFYGTKNNTYTIDKKAVTITPASRQSKKYGTIDPVLTYTASPTLFGSDVFTGSLSRATGDDAGTYAMYLGSLSAGDNYAFSLALDTVNFTIEQVKVEGISTTVSNIKKTAYEVRNATTAQALVDSVGLPSSVSVTTDGSEITLPITWGTSTIYNAKGVEYVVIGTLTGNSNIDTNGVTKNLTITVAPVTAVDPTFSHMLAVINSDTSATAAELGVSILPTSGSISIEGVIVTYTIHWNGGQTLDRTTVGNEQTFTGTISYASPPIWLTMPSDFSVSRKVTVTAKPSVTIGGIATPNKTYDGTGYASIGTVTVSAGSVPVGQLEWLYESTDNAGYSSSTAPTDAGVYKLTISVPESNANYAGSEVFTFTIEKRQITLTADNKTVVKGASLPELTYMVSNLPTGKTKADAFSAEPTLTCPTFDGNILGNYGINITSGTATDNYTIAARKDGTLTVAEQTYTGGGSGGDNSYTPSMPAITTSAKKPDQPVTAEISVTAMGGANGAANVSILEKSITDAITKAQTDVKVQGKTANGIAVALKVALPRGTTSFTATLSRNSLNSLVSAGVSSLTLAGSPVDVGFDLKALQEIQKQSSGAVTISITPVRKLSTGAQTMIGGRPVYEIIVSYVKDGKAITVSAFHGGMAIISIPYALGRNETAGYLYGVYVDAKGNPQRIDGSAYDANAGAILISIEHLSVYGVGYTAPSGKYIDINTHWAKESIDYVVGRGLLTGTTKTTFAPNNAMTRGMLVMALGRLAGVDTKLYTTNSFTDVKADSTFHPYIEWAYKKDVVQGIGNGKFAPDRAITHEEIAVIFANYAKATGYKLPVTRTATTFADASSIGSTYKTAVIAMQQAGIMRGGTNNQFNPKFSVTRGEVSAMLNRYIKLTINPATAQGWVQNDAGQYLYYKDGKALTDTQTIDDVKYFFGTDGTLKTDWVKDGDNWRFYSGKTMLVGWWDIGANGNNKTYYFTKDGLMVSGKWLEINGKWYYFYADGSLAKSTKINGYEADAKPRV